MSKIPSKSASIPLPKQLLLACTIAALAFPASAAPGHAVLNPDAMRRHVEHFNRIDHTHFGQAISNETTADWMAANVPLFDCPDPGMAEIYHFSWWTYRKHIKKPPDGYVITQFLPKVTWSGKHNTISPLYCYDFREGRWIRNTEYPDDYSVFWFRKGGSSRLYGF